jgi:serine/threonine-protein kinase HipA
MKRDDHAKNFSFIRKGGEWFCSPGYDLVYSSGFNGNHSTTINGKGNPSVEDLYIAGERAGLAADACKRIIEEVKSATKDLARLVERRFLSG